MLFLLTYFISPLHMFPSRICAAEFLGAFTLSLLVGLSLAFTMPLATPIIAGLTLGVFVYTIGPISGAHINPAVTIALLSVKKISPIHAAYYIVSQLVGGGLALIVLALFWRTSVVLNVVDSTHVAVLEAMGAFVLLFGISSVVHGKVKDSASGLVIGTSLLLGILIASNGARGILNPAVALGIRSFSIAYVAGPIIGAILGAWAYRLIVR